MPVWWSVKQIAEAYSLSERTVYHAIENGDLIAHRFGRRRGGIRVAEVDRLEWEKRCRDGKLTPTPNLNIPSKPFTDLAKKHFDL